MKAILCSLLGVSCLYAAPMTAVATAPTRDECALQLARWVLVSANLGDLTLTADPPKVVRSFAQTIAYPIPFPIPSFRGRWYTYRAVDPENNEFTVSIFIDRAKDHESPLYDERAGKIQSDQPGITYKLGVREVAGAGPRPLLMTTVEIRNQAGHVIRRGETYDGDISWRIR